MSGKELDLLGRRIDELDAAIAAGKERMLEANLRLVLSIAKNRRHHGMEIGDLVQEGALGLLNAATKFDYRRGFKFSTYASWWILQSINRAINDKASIIRLPAHLHERLGKVRAAVRRFEERNDRAPDPGEISAGVRLSPEQVHETLGAAPAMLSLSTDLGPDEGMSLESVLSDPLEPSVHDKTDAVMRRQEVEKCLARLKPTEAEVLRQRFGLTARLPATLDEVGRSIGVSRERVRQIELQAIVKLRTGPDHRMLADYA
jgi:RNA polymerase primary sigma factor